MTSAFAILALVTVATLLEGGSCVRHEITNEHVRDAILSLLTMFRDSGEKLERHEYRERQLGEQLKKALSGLDKRYRNQDQNIDKIATLMLKLEERIKNFEMLMAQKDERERIQLQKSQNAIEGVRSTLDKIMSDLDGSSKVNATAHTIQESYREHVEALGKSLKADLNNVTAMVAEVQAKVMTEKPAEESNSIELSEELKKSILETERILQKMLKESGETKANNSKWRGELTALVDKQHKEVKELLQLSTRTAKEIGELPTRLEVRELHNATQETLLEMKEELMSVSDQGVSKVSMKMDEAIAGVNSGQDDIVKSISDIQSLGENLYSDTSRSYEHLLKEIKGLSRVEQVMIQTADNVLDTKRRIEYGIHQILLEVGDLIKIQAKSLNTTLNQRFDDIEVNIVENQTGALTNLSSKIEGEISQVWRQIGTMHHELTSSANTLDKLQQQTDAYVNDTVKVMDGMGGKVSEITARMTEIDENLNYLIGRLSLVTSEFNQIKSGLASALDNIRNNFHEIQGDIKDVAPGPQPIPQEENNMLPPPPPPPPEN